MKKLRTVKSFRQLLRLLSCWYLYQVLQVNLFARFVKVKRTKIKFSKSRLPLKLVRLSCHSEEGSKLERKKKKIQTSHFTFFFLFVCLPIYLIIHLVLSHLAKLAFFDLTCQRSYVKEPKDSFFVTMLSKKKSRNELTNFDSFDEK
jgi:hypothetical protein